MEVEPRHDAGGAHLVRHGAQVREPVGVGLPPGEVAARARKRRIGNHPDAEPALLHQADVLVDVRGVDRAHHPVTRRHERVAPHGDAARQRAVALERINRRQKPLGGRRHQRGPLPPQTQRRDRPGLEDTPAFRPLRTPRVDLHGRLLGHHRHGRRLVPRHVRALSEMRALPHGQAQELERVDLRGTLVAERFDLVAHAFGRKQHVVRRLPHAQLQNEKLVLEADLQAVAAQHDPRRGNAPRLRGKDQLVLVVVGTALHDRDERHAHARHQAFDVCRLDDERFRRAAVREHEPECLVLKGDVRPTKRRHCGKGKQG